jgi:hypothetical protein
MAGQSFGAHFVPPPAAGALAAAAGEGTDAPADGGFASSVLPNPGVSNSGKVARALAAGVVGR